jgi:leucyl-tRNA synthetase
MNTFRSREKKWQQYWREQGTFDVDIHRMNNPFYILTMFPYPSGDRLHLGHWFQYGLMDSWARFQKLKGKEIFQPMGFDAFGLPAENHAIKKGIHPAVSTEANIAHMKHQFDEMGTAYDWNYSINSSDPGYYRWTQWLFVQLFNSGLAYQKKAPVNYCPSCTTVLANEQVVQGRCERCDTEVVQKELKQWFFKLSEYSEELLEGLDELDWPEQTKAMQREWIGKKTGASISFPREHGGKSIEVFTTRPDTFFGVAAVVLAPEHPLLSEMITGDRAPELELYLEQCRKRSELDRIRGGNEKTGVFTGSYCIHPASSEPIPIWISDYVLANFGTAAVMLVPAHDQRDFDFARTFDIPFQAVIEGYDGKRAMCETGKLIHSQKFNGLQGDDAARKIVAAFPEHMEWKTSYRLRDWLVSRQRYWGAPIPIIHCKTCGAVADPDLPVKLPGEVDFTRTGESPLKTVPSFVQTHCPQCGG